MYRGHCYAPPSLPITFCNNKLECLSLPQIALVLFLKKDWILAVCSSFQYLHWMHSTRHILNSYARTEHSSLLVKKWTLPKKCFNSICVWGKHIFTWFYFHLRFLSVCFWRVIKLFMLPLSSLGQAAKPLLPKFRTDKLECFNPLKHDRFVVLNAVC